MAETANVKTYAPQYGRTRKKKRIKTVMSGPKKKNKTGGTKHVVASEGGSL